MAAKELFGDVGGGVNLDSFLPKTVKDFEDYAQTLANRFVLCHKDSKNYKVNKHGGSKSWTYAFTWGEQELD